MEDSTGTGSGTNGFQRGQPSANDWAAIFAHTVAHLAAQLTMTQVRLRALASEVTANGGIDEQAVQRRVREIASTETGVYLRESLGETLTELIDFESLQADIIDFLNAPEAR
jgi:hypothetical protein